MNVKGSDSFISWLVVLGGCIIYALNLSTFRMSGLVYLVLMDRYNISREKASVPIILFNSMACLTGPFTGIIGQKIGLEEITIIGCILTSVGIGACYFAQDITIVVVFLGVLHGIGRAFSIAFLPNIFRYHFTRNLNLVNGLLGVGLSAGGFIFPPIAYYFLDTFGTSGTFLIVSGVMLQGVPIAMLLKTAGFEYRKSSLKPKIMSTDQHNGDNEINSTVPETRNSDSIYTIYKSGKLKNDAQLENTNDYNLHVTPGLYSTKENGTSLENRQNSVNIASKGTLHNEQVLLQTIKLRENSSSMFNENVNKKYSGHTFQQVDKSASSYNLNLSVNNENISSDKNYKNCHRFNDGKNFNIKDTKLASSNSSTKNNKNKYMLNSLKIFLDPTYLIILIIQSLNLYIIVITMTILLDYSLDKGISKENEIYILMIPSLFEMVGRGALMLLVDKGILTITTFTMVFYFILSLSVCGLVLSKDIISLITAATVFNITAGAVSAIIPGIIFKFMQKEMHTMAMSCKFSLYLPLSFSSSSLIGFFREEIESYDGLCCVIIALCLVNCIIIPLLPFLSKVKVTDVEKEKH